MSISSGDNDVGVIHDEAQGIKSTVALIQGVFAAIIIAVLLWVGTEITDLGKKMERLQTLYDAQSQLLEQRERLAKLERDQVKTYTTAEITKLSSTIDALQVSIRQIWPRIRANSENISLLRESIKDEHPTAVIDLKTPETY